MMCSTSGGRARAGSWSWPPNKRFEAGGARRLRNEFFFSAPQLKRSPLGSHLNPFAQDYAACRCEWGTDGLAALAPADVTIIIDVFTFTTCVDVALGAGGIILPYRWDDPTAADYAARNKAELAGKRRQARYSLAPECYVDAPAGLRCVLPSPTGAR